MVQNYIQNFRLNGVNYFTLFLFLLLFQWNNSTAQVDVTATGGTPTGSYTTIKAAFDAINAGTHTTVITIALSGDTTETASAVLNASGSGSASYSSITISPSGGATRTISGAIVAGSPLIDLNGADNVTFDGLATGGNALVISNTTVSATSGTSTIRFIGGATSNLITNCSVLGAGTMSVVTNGGNIFFSTDSLTTNGNDNNTISNCNIGPVGTNLPTKGVFSNGTTTTAAIGNSGNIVTNNNIFDFFGAAVTSSGISLQGGTNTWTITNNRFYQTGSRTWTTGAIHRAIEISSTTTTSGNQGHTVTDNIIGYSSNLQTGVYTLTGSTGKFQAIYFNGISTGTISNINNNTIASVSLTGVTSSGTSTSSPMIGILIANGLANTNNNIIGSQNSVGSLVFNTNSTTSTDVIGIYNFSVDDWTANNNTIGGISVTNAAASGTFIIYGMRANTSSTKVFNGSQNSIGGTISNSIQLNATGTSCQVIGIHTSNAGLNLTSNSIRNLTTNIGTGTTTAASVIGINSTTSTPNHSISQNSIYNLRNTNTTAASIVTGIQFTGGTANTIQRNLIYDLYADTNSATAEINGIRIAGGTTVYRNNMIRIGNGVTNAVIVSGINEALGTNNIWHNSIYIDGAPTAGTASSYAFNGQQTVNTRSFRNNIFFNARNNSGATGKNYAVRVGGTGVNPTGLTINNNIYFANGSGAVFGFYASADVANLAAWKVAVGQDANSFESNPQFNNPTAALPDLHLHPSNATVAEGNGTDLGVLDDFDGETRSGLTPVDIGADAGNYVGTDLSGPAITFTSLGLSCSTSDRVLSGVVITDVTGVPTSGALQPRIYYRKNAGTWFSSQGTLTSGTGTNGTWSFTIVAADMGGVTGGDTVQYYLIAQDLVGTPNLASNPAGVVATDVNTITTAPSAPNSYNIGSTLSGTYTVGATGNYTTLTAAINAYNTSCLSGAVTFSLIDATYPSETFPLVINANTYASNTNTLTIKPAIAGVTISGSSATSILNVNGGDYVIIDGSVGTTVNSVCPVSAASRDLTIANTNTGTTSAVVWLNSTATSDSATNNTVKNCVVVGNGPTTTLVGIGAGGTAISSTSAGASNNNLSFINNDIRACQFGIYSSGTNATSKNQNFIANQNSIVSSGTSSVGITGIYCGYTNNITISGNTFGNIASSASQDIVAINLGFAATSGFSTSLTGNADGVSNATITNNTIGVVTNSGTYSAIGIGLGNTISGTNLIANNMISGVASNSTSPDLTAGIILGGGTGATTNIYHNTVVMQGTLPGATAASQASACLAVTATTAPTLDIKNNILVNTQVGNTSATTKFETIGLAYTSTTGNYAGLASNNNLLYAAGAGPGTYMVAITNGITGGTAQTALSNWQTETGRDASSLNSNPVFVSSTDLHIVDSDPANTTLSSGGTATSVTTDFDCATRNASTPTIGADENVFLPTNNFNDLTGFKAYPNPTSGVLTIEYTSELSLVKVFNMLGQEVMLKKLNETSVEINLSDLNAGTYLVKIEADNASKIVKVIKR